MNTHTKKESLTHARVEKKTVEIAGEINYMSSLVNKDFKITIKNMFKEVNRIL